MNHVLTEAEYRLARGMKTTGVLTEIVPHDLTCLSNGAVLVQCPDCDQRLLWEQYIAGLCAVHNGGPRVHSLALHSGAAVIPPHSPSCHEGEESRVMLRQIGEALPLKGILTIIAAVHWRCGKLAAARVDFAGAIELAVQAGVILTERFTDAVVLNTLSINYGCGVFPDHQGMKTYQISSEAWARHGATTEQLAVAAVA